MRKKLQQPDERLKRAIVKMSAEQLSFDEICFTTITECTQLINAITDRMMVKGLEGNKLNYPICKRIAELRFRLEQLRVVFSTDNIDMFERLHFKRVEEDVRYWREQKFPPRREWARCQDCGGMVHPRKSMDSEPFDRDNAKHLRVASLLDVEPSRIYRCHKCVD